MPVSLLLCEGGPSSPDMRVLGKLLAGRCEVRPHGGKYGMGAAILARREVMGSSAVFGILDGDFPDTWHPPAGKPVLWTISDGTKLGWRWERKEIENYLLDPSVVKKALRNDAPPAANLVTALEAARDHLTLYQAARAALSERRQRFLPLSCSFGRPQGREKHLFPDDTCEEACRGGIQKCVDTYNQEQSVTVDSVNAAFDTLKPEFCPGGSRYQHYLGAFAGKDLLWAMDSAIRDFGFEGALPFREKILVGIQKTTDDIGDWLPEWKALQKAVDND